MEKAACHHAHDHPSPTAHTQLAALHVQGGGGGRLIPVILRGVLDVKKVDRALFRTEELRTFLGCRKVDFWFPLAREKPEIHPSTPGQKSIKRTQKYVVLGVFGYFPKISKFPYAKNIIDTAFSFEDRGGTTNSYVL
jgi:hypothetical protein